MAKTISADMLASAVSELLEEYADECDDILEECVDKVVKDAAKELKNAGDFEGTGKYRKGWKSKVEKTRIGVEGVVYNATYPGLTHLLENGHATADGGRTRKFEHIAPVNDQAQESIIDELERKL